MFDIVDNSMPGGIIRDAAAESPASNPLSMIKPFHRRRHPPIPGPEQVGGKSKNCPNQDVPYIFTGVFWP